MIAKSTNFNIIIINFYTMKLCFTIPFVNENEYVSKFKNNKS
jgi:hypothetical protein